MKLGYDATLDKGWGDENVKLLEQSFLWYNERIETENEQSGGGSRKKEGLTGGQCDHRAWRFHHSCH